MANCRKIGRTQALRTASGLGADDLEARQKKDTATAAAAAKQEAPSTAHAAAPLPVPEPSKTP